MKIYKIGGGIMICVGVFYHYKYLLQYSYLITYVIS